MTSVPELLKPVVCGLAAWVIPGAGYFLLNEKKRAVIIFIAITLTFGIGLYIGSIGVVDPIGSKFAYIGQIMNSPAVALIARFTATGNYPVYGRSQEIGQIYTVISGMLNLLCIVNVFYLAYIRQIAADRRVR